MISTNKTTIKRGAHSKRSVCGRAGAGLKRAREHSLIMLSEAAQMRLVKQDAARKAAVRLASGVDPLIALRDSLNGKSSFKEDGLTYQKRMRDEWDD